jgi:hypothetical protein
MSEQKNAAEKYADIEREAAQIAGQIPDAPTHARRSLAALMQHEQGLTVIEYCPHCEGRLSVAAQSESAWQVSCACGRSDNAFRGL